MSKEMSRPGVAGSLMEPYTYVLQRTPQPPAPRKRKRHDSFDRTSDGTDGAARQEGRPRALGRQALRALAALLIERQPDILKANALDVDAAKAANMDAPRLDRLTLTPRIMADMADACLHVAEMADEVGVIEQQWQRPNGLMIGIIMTALPEPESTKKFKIVTKTKRSRIVNAGPLPSSIWPM